MNDPKNIAETDPVDRLLREKKTPSSGKGIAILALLVALAAVSQSAWRWWQEYSTDSSGQTMQESIQQVRNSQQQLFESVNSVQSRVDVLANDVKSDEIATQAGQLVELEKTVDKLNRQSEEDKAAMSAMQGSIRSEELRISAVEAGLINVAANSRNSSVELELAEIGFVLRAASERLQLFSDPEAADLALHAADNLVEALRDPMFLSVRQRIAAARQTLSEVPRIDELELSASISDLQSKIPDLPFKGQVAAAPLTVLPEDAGWWASFKNSLSSLVTVRRRVPIDEELLSLEDKDYLRQGLWLQFESARLSLMRRDDKTFQLSLQRVSDTLNQFFENGASPVQKMMQDLAALQLADIAPEMPDISGPWTQLQQLRDSRRLLNSAPAADPVEEPPEVSSPQESEPDPAPVEDQPDASNQANSR